MRELATSPCGKAWRREIPPNRPFYIRILGIVNISPRIVRDFNATISITRAFPVQAASLRARVSGAGIRCMAVCGWKSKSSACLMRMISECRNINTHT
eukprot:5562470-Pyramimonas_sp.AAC.2